MKRFLGANTSSQLLKKQCRYDHWLGHVDIPKEHGKGHVTAICSHCNKGIDADGKRVGWKTTGVRVDAHLKGIEGQGVKPCQSIPQKQRDRLNGKVAASSIQHRFLKPSGKAASQQVAEAFVARCFHYNGMALNIANSPAFREMCVDIGTVGSEFNVPSRYRLGGKLLDEEYARVQDQVLPLLDSGKEIGVTICSYGWTDINRHLLVNVQVNTVNGPLFLNA